jgi:hypothetical protein
MVHAARPIRVTLLGVSLAPNERVLHFSRRRIGPAMLVSLIVLGVALVTSAALVALIDFAVLRLTFGLIFTVTLVISFFVLGLGTMVWQSRPRALAVTTDRVLSFTKRGLASEVRWADVSDVQAVRGTGSAPETESLALGLVQIAAEAATDVAQEKYPKLGPEYWSGASGLIVIDKKDRRVAIESPRAPLIGQRIAARVAGSPDAFGGLPDVDFEA